MTDPITPEIFQHLVELAALELDPGEAEYIRRQLNNQIKAINELEAIPLDADTRLTSHGVPYPPEISPALRDDEWLPSPTADAILKQAPQTEDRYIVVPDIPHTTLE
jgi:aspartyl-tRNA(Asn)/glutamyl-tRNA(Gln) amidotransferase subunit C